jgi:usherin
VENFTIQRRVKGKEDITTLVTHPRSHSMRFLDKAPALSPWTKYEYQVQMSTLDGSTNSSAWVEVTTKPSQPAGVQLPVMQVLGSNAAKVRHWLLADRIYPDPLCVEQNHLLTKRVYLLF